MQTTMTRRLEFDAGHRLQGHESKCRHVHGHRYVAEITCAGPMDGVGRVIDFSRVKEVVGGWLDAQWDHGFIAEHGDPLVPWLEQHGMKHYLLETPPSAEHMAEHLLQKAQALLAPHGITVPKVRLYETPNGWADAEQGP